MSKRKSKKARRRALATSKGIIEEGLAILDAIRDVVDTVAKAERVARRLAAGVQELRRDGEPTVGAKAKKRRKRKGRK